MGNRKYGFDGIVMEIAVPQYFERFLSHLADTIHSLPGEKRVVVVIPPSIAGYPSAEVNLYRMTIDGCSDYSILPFMSISFV